jgi:hypothetical protein
MLNEMGKTMKLKVKAKLLAKIKKPEMCEEKVIETSQSFQIKYCENIKIKLFQPVEFFEY